MLSKCVNYFTYYINNIINYIGRTKPMKIEFVSDGGKDFPTTLIEKSRLIANTLAQLLFEVEVFKYSESHQIILDYTLSTFMPTKEQTDLFVEEVKQSTNTCITMFRYKTEKIESIIVSLDLIRVARGYSTVVTEIGKCRWAVSSEEIDFERIN